MESLKYNLATMNENDPGYEPEVDELGFPLEGIVDESGVYLPPTGRSPVITEYGMVVQPESSRTPQRPVRSIAKIAAAVQRNVEIRSNRG